MANLRDNCSFCMFCTAPWTWLSDAPEKDECKECSPYGPEDHFVVSPIPWVELWKDKNDVY